MPIKLPTVQTGFEQSIDKAAKRAGKNLKINMGPGAKSIEGLTRPLGRLTGKADEFTKSMEAANARVLAFGASVGVIAAVSNALKQLVTTSIEVEKSLTNINSILKQSESQLNGFKDQIFDIARNTGQTFDIVAEAALELSRQGLTAEQVTKRLNDSLVLSRLSGLSAADSVAGLTAAVNSFSKAGLTTSDVLNKISAAAASAAVSDRDLIEGLKRSGAVAVASGVKFDELIGIISALQERTASGGSVIGNSLKTIFTRIQDLDRLNSLKDLGVQVTDLEGNVLSSSKIIENLAPTFARLDQASKVNLADNLVGKFQIAPFLALLEDFNQKISRSGEVATTSFNASNEAYKRNEVLNKTLATAINTATVNLKELANALGEIGVTENLSKIIGVFNDIASSITKVLDGDGMGSKFAKGLIKGISNVIAGPGLALALLAIGKLLLDFAKFGTKALSTFFGLNKAAEAQKILQGQIAASLLNDKGVRDAILSIEKQNISAGEKKKLQTQFFTKALNEQLMVMQKMQGIARTVAPGVMMGTASSRGRRAAGGFLPVGAEKSDISRGVGGAPASAKPVVIPNFAFGSGKRGTMVANSSEYIVPNYANGGDAIFNQNMASSMGLPANARKVRAASGYIPNFANEDERLILFAGDRGGDFKKIFHVGKTKANETRAYASKDSAPKGMRTTPVTVPTYRMKGGKGDSEPKDIEFIKKRLSNTSTDAALKFAKDLSGKSKLPNLSKKKIQGLFNPGSFEGMSGTIFEVAIASILKSREFADYAARHSNARIDLPYSPRLFGKFGAKGKGELGAEVKANSGLAASAAVKFYDILVGAINPKTGKREFGQVATYKDNRFFGKTLSQTEFKKLYPDGIGGKKYGAVQGMLGGTVTRGGARNLFARSASGYIPNFAEGALENAIGREKAAGLPVSQIRINQSGKLRNSQNPMGLAVTNTRDEPTGAIPNYAKKGSGAGGEAIADGLLTKLFAVQMGFGVLSGLLGEVSEKNKLVSGSLTALNAVVMAAMSAQAFGGVKNIAASLIGGGSLGAKGSMMFGMGQARMTAGRSAMSVGRRLGSTSMVRGGALSGLKGAAGMLGGAFLKILGPIGLLTAAFFGIKKIMDIFSGSAEQVTKNNEFLSVATKKAARELEELKFASTRDREDFTDTSETFANRFKHSALNVGFAGDKDDQLGDQAFKMAKAAYDAGATEKQVTDALEIAKQLHQTQNRAGDDLDSGDFSGPSYTQNEIGAAGQEAMRAHLQKLIDRDTSAIQDEMLSTITDEQKLTLARGNKIDASKEDQDNAAAVRKALMDSFTEFAKNNPSKDIASELDQAILKLGAQEGAKIQEQTESIRTQTAKAVLQTEINILKIKSEALTEDEKKLSISKITKNLTESQTLDLEKRIKLNKLDVDQNLKILGIVEKRIQGIDKLVVNEGQALALKKALQNLSIEELSNEGDLEKLVKKVLGLNGELTEQQKESLKNIQQSVLGIKQEAKQKKLNLDLAAKQRREELKINQAIEARIGLLQRGIKSKDIDTNAGFVDRQFALDLEKARVDNNPNLTDEQKAAKAVEFAEKQKEIDIDKAKAKAVSEAKTKVVELSKALGENFNPMLEQLMGILNNPAEHGGVEGAVGKVQSRIRAEGDKSRDLTPAEVMRNRRGIFGNFVAERLGSQGSFTPIDGGFGFKGGETLKNAAVDMKQTKATLQEEKKRGEHMVTMAKIARQGAGAFADFNKLLADFIRNLRASAEQLRFDSLGSQDSSSMMSNLDARILNARMMNNPTAEGISDAASKAGLENLDRQIFMAGSTGEKNKLTRDREVLVEQLALKNEIMNIDAAAPDAEERLLKIREKLLVLDKKRSEAQKRRTLKERRDDRAMTPLDINDQFLTKVEQTGITFRENFVRAFAEGIESVDSLEDALLNAANQFLKSMTTNFVDKFMNEAMSGGSGGKGSGGEGSGGGGILKKIFGSIGSFLGFADGGKVRGGSGNRDDVPAMLMGGEYVMNKKAVQRYGSGFMEALNSGSVRGFSKGGEAMINFFKEKNEPRLIKKRKRKNSSLGGQSMDEEGMFTTPGMNGAGKIVGMRNLMSFATQTPTALGRDDIRSEGAFLDAESGRFTMFGRRNNPEFQKVQDAKRQALGLVASEMEAHKQAKEQEVSLGKMLASAAISTIVSFGVSKLGMKALKGIEGGEGMAKLIGSSAGNFAGTKITGAPSYGGAIGAAAAGGDLKKLFTGSKSEKDPNTEKKATGGLIRDAGGVDTVPAMLSGGEFVMNAAATKNIGAGNLQALNSGVGTGDNSDLVAKLDQLITATETSQSTGDINITINGSDGTESQTGGEDAPERERKLSERIKVAVKQVIADEQRLGGQLRK